MSECIKELVAVEDEENACKVVITCKQPKEDGSMNVEMSYEGDKMLASYLLHSAQNMIDG